MKQKIYLLGVVTTVLIIIGTLFKINHWPAAGIMVSSGMVALILVFLPLALRNNYMTDSKGQYRGLYIVTWLTCFVIFGSMLFKFMHWPGAGYGLILGLPFPYVVFLPVFLIITSKIKNYSIYNTVYVLFLLVMFSVFSALLALNVSRTRIDDSLNLSKRYNNLEAALDKAKISEIKSPLMQKIDDLLVIVSDYQNEILKEDELTVQQWNDDPKLLLVPESSNIVPQALKTGKGQVDLRLEDGLRSFMKELDDTPGYGELAKSAAVLFNFNDIPDIRGEWTSLIFRSQVQSWVLIYLDGLETNLKLIRATL